MWATVIVIALALASARPPVRATARPVSVQPPQSQPVTLTLECVDSANIRFEITNVGSTDTALRLGSILANGRKYMVAGLHLRLKPPNGNDTDTDYWPRDYPARLPAGSISGSRRFRWRRLPHVRQTRRLFESGRHTSISTKGISCRFGGRFLRRNRNLWSLSSTGRERSSQTPVSLRDRVGNRTAADNVSGARSIGTVGPRPPGHDHFVTGGVEWRRREWGCPFSRSSRLERLRLCLSRRQPVN